MIYIIREQIQTDNPSDQGPELKRFKDWDMAREYCQELYEDGIKAYISEQEEVLTHDRTNPREVHVTMLEVYPGTSAKDWTPEMIEMFIPEGADASYWQKVLRNTEYNINNPKPKRKSRRSAGKGPNNKHNNPGRLVIGRDLVSK